MDPQVYFNGSFISERDATVSVRSRALNYGLGCFGGIRAYWSDRRRELFVFRLDDHVARLVESARILGLESPFPPAAIAELVIDLLRRNRCRGDTYVRPLLYVDSDELSPTMSDVPVSLSVYCMPMGRYFAHESIHCCVSSWRRVADNAIPARAKPLLWLCAAIFFAGMLLATASNEEIVPPFFAMHALWHLVGAFGFVVLWAFNHVRFAGYESTANATSEMKSTMQSGTTA